MLQMELEELPSIEYTSRGPYVVYEHAGKLAKSGSTELVNIDDNVHCEWASTLAPSIAHDAFECLHAITTPPNVLAIPESIRQRQSFFPPELICDRISSSKRTKHVFKNGCKLRVAKVDNLSYVED
ncbi:hypothetical protein Adt_41141 [Abeliophyllum distichum]|uniref:Uncharacterized protein n=1 Tax=Abeliophyllum distichum TaxID=126358 RepID=A0ABD1PMY9_9LAMI